MPKSQFIDPAQVRLPSSIDIPAIPSLSVRPFPQRRTKPLQQ